MLRIHFTAQDLANLTFADQPDPMWELLLSLHALQRRDDDIYFGQWRRSAAQSVAREQLQLLLELAPATGYSPDFITPAATASSFGDALERVLTTPQRIVRAQLRHLAHRKGRSTPLIDDLASDRCGARRRLGEALRAYHRGSMAAYWPSLRDHVLVDRARRMQQWAAKGADWLLANLHPGIVWNPPVLGVLDFVDTDFHLDGRGLRLVPSVFCWQAPTKLYDPDLPPVLVYPTAAPPGTLRSAEGDPVSQSTALAALLGRTRARMLEAAAIGCSTSELAVRCGVSIAAASQQTAVLRAAGLIQTRREGIAVRHEITVLGMSLLQGVPSAG